MRSLDATTRSSARNALPSLTVDTDSDSLPRLRSGRKPRSAPARLQQPQAEAESLSQPARPPRLKRSTKPQANPRQPHPPPRPPHESESPWRRLFGGTILILLLIPVFCYPPPQSPCASPECPPPLNTVSFKNISNIYDNNVIPLIAISDKIEHLPPTLRRVKAGVGVLRSNVLTNTLRNGSQKQNLTLEQRTVLGNSISVLLRLSSLAADQSSHFDSRLNLWLDNSISNLYSLPSKLERAGDLERNRTKLAARLLRFQERFLSQHRHTVQDVVALCTHGSLSWDVCSVHTLALNKLHFHLRFFSESTANVLKLGLTLFETLAQFYDSLQELERNAKDLDVNLQQAITSDLLNAIWFPRRRDKEYGAPASSSFALGTLKAWFRKIAKQNIPPAPPQRIYPTLDVIIFTSMVHVTHTIQSLWHLKRSLCTLVPSQVAALPRQDRQQILKAEEKHGNSQRLERSFLCDASSNGFLERLQLELHRRPPIHVYGRNVLNDTDNASTPEATAVPTNPPRNPSPDDCANCIDCPCPVCPGCTDCPGCPDCPRIPDLQHLLHATAETLSAAFSQYSSQRKQRWRTEGDMMLEETMENWKATQAMMEDWM